MIDGAAGRIIRDALGVLGRIAPGQEPSPEALSDGQRYLNVLAKHLQNDGLPLWARSSIEVELEDGQSAYTIGSGFADVFTARPTRILQAVRRNETDVPVQMVSYNTYFDQVSKESAGLTVMAAFESGTTSGTLHVWPAGKTGEKLVIMYQRPFSDLDELADIVDFPEEWFLALTYGLATILADRYGMPPDRQYLLARKAEGYRERAMDASHSEDASVFFSPRRW